MGKESEAGCGIRRGRRFSKREMCSSDVPILRRKNKIMICQIINFLTEKTGEEKARVDEPGGVSTIK